MCIRDSMNVAGFQTLLSYYSRSFYAVPIRKEGLCCHDTMYRFLYLSKKRRMHVTAVFPKRCDHHQNASRPQYTMRLFSAAAGKSDFSCSPCVSDRKSTRIPQILNISMKCGEAPRRRHTAQAPDASSLGMAQAGSLELVSGNR